MEQQDPTGKKDAGDKSSEMQDTEKEMPEIKDENCRLFENRCANKGTRESGLSEETVSKASVSRINSPLHVVKDRGKGEFYNESEASRNMSPAKRKDFRESAKYRDAESYDSQHHHSIGNGLYLTNSIEDLPPRFRKLVRTTLKEAHDLNIQIAAKALAEAAALNNIKLDRHPLEYFADKNAIESFINDDDSKELDKKLDKLVYIPPDVLENERRSDLNKSNFASSSKSNFTEKNASDLHHPDSHPAVKTSESRKPFSDNLVSQVSPQNIRDKTGCKSKRPFPRTNSNECGSKQSTGKSVSLLNIKNPCNQTLDPYQTNLSMQVALPPKAFRNSSEYSGSETSISKSISDLHSNNSCASSKISTQKHQYNNYSAIEDEVAFYQQLTKDHENFLRSKKSTANSKSNNYGKRISVDELFRQNKTTENAVTVSCSKNLSGHERAVSSTKIPDSSIIASTSSDSGTNANFKTHDEQRSFSDHKKLYKNKNSFKSQSEHSNVSYNQSYENKFREDSSRPAKKFVNHSDSSTKYNSHASESIKEVRSESKQPQSNTISEKKSTLKCNENQRESLSVKQNVQKSPSYYGKGNFSKSKNISPQNYNNAKGKNYDNYRHSKAQNDKNYPIEERLSCNASIPSEKQSSVVQDSSSNNNYVQNRHRTNSDSHSFISSSYSSNSGDKVPQHHNSHSNVKDGSRNSVPNVNSNHNSFESIPHPESKYKQNDKDSNFNKKYKNSRHNRETYSDSSNVISDKSGRISDFSYNRSSNGMCNQKDSKGDFNWKSKNYRHQRETYNDSSSVVSDKSARTSNFSNTGNSSEKYNQRDTKGDFYGKSKNFRHQKETHSDSSSVLSDKCSRTSNFSNINNSSERHNLRDNKGDFYRKSKNYGHQRETYSDSSSVLSDKSAGISNFSNSNNSNDNQRSTRDDFNKRSKNFRYQTENSRDSASVLSDKSAGTFNFSNSNSNEACEKGDNKCFVKPLNKHFNEKKGKKFFQKSQSSFKDQEISKRSCNSFSSAKYNDYSDQTINRSTYSNENLALRSTKYERGKENDDRICIENGFFIKVEVSENATDLEYWMNYFKDIFRFHFDFERCCRFSDVLILEFERKEHAHTACDILYREKKVLQNSNKPHVLAISKLLHRIIKPCNCQKNVIIDCLNNIEKHFESSLYVLRQKFKDEHGNSKDAFNSDESQILEESVLAFTKFKDETVNFIKEAADLRTVQHHRHSFIRECNIFKRCLPIYSKKFEILHYARFYPVSVIVAETGSGKSTQLVEYLLHSSIFAHGSIICTQPRKLAAISIAQYVSGQIGSAVGKIVGYDVGTEKKYSDAETKVIFMTDYCLLKYFLRNRNLKGVSCIIIDEAHERSLYTDLILGLLKQCFNVRRDLSVLITSATINPATFVDYFDMSEECVIEVPGRTYPVDVVWLKEDVEIGWDYLNACVRQAYDIHMHQAEGDILVFLTSPSESEEAIYLLSRLLKKNKVELLSLHGKTDIQEQMLIFKKTSKFRKIIFTTNVAETAVTIPGIKYVIDSGMTKELMFDPQKNKSYLAVTFTTKSSAEQRKGRAGRTQSGICYRMYSERNYTKDMANNVIPEILKSNLQKALLKIFELGIDPENFDFIEAPPARTISNSIESLEHLGAISNKKLTDFGKKLAKLPLEPQLSKLVLQGIEAKIGIEAIVIAALLTESSKLFIRNEENKALADEKKRKFCHKGGDLCTFLEIYKNYKKIYEKPERYDWCVENYLSFKALSAAAKTVKEILITLRTELGIYVSSQYNNDNFKKQYEKIIFESFSENLCVLSGHPKLGYLSPYLSESFFIHPSSTLSYLGKDSPEFLVYSTLMETSRNFLFDVTPISEATLKAAYQSGKFRLPVHTLRSLQIPPKIMGPFGESVLIRHILGKGGSKIRDLEKALMQLTSVKNLYVDVDVIKGLLTVYLSNRAHEKAENYIQQIINKALDEMLSEEDVAKLSGTCLYFALGAGGVINDIIIPGEFREIIFNRVKSKDSSELESILQTYGPLQSFSRITNKQETQICATFKKVSDAEEAYLDLKRKNYVVSPKPHLPAVNNKTLPYHYMLLISWCCRPSNGYGFVELFSEDDLIEASGTLTCNSFFVGNNLIMFEVANEKRRLNMKNLPEYVEEHCIREKLKESLPHIKIKFIQIHRKPLKVTHDTVEDTKKKLSKLLGLYISPSKFTIDLKDPERKESWNATVYFDNAKDAEVICKKLENNTCIDTYPLTVRLAYKCQMRCMKDVYDHFSRDVNNTLQIKQNEGVCDEFSIKLLKGKVLDVLIEFSCINSGELDKIRNDLRPFLEGECLCKIGNSKYYFLFTGDSVKLIRNIQKSTETFIKVDKFKKAVLIYGSPGNCKEAIYKIEQLASNSDCFITRSFNLEDSCIPKGFLKELYSRYGYDLDGLTASFKLSVALIDNYGRTLTLKGLKEQIRKAEQALEKLCEELFKSRGRRQKTSSSEETCPICFDPVSFDFQRLEHCGHAFCRQCLLLQLESKMMPLACVKQGCGKLIFLEDIKRIISFGGDHLKKTFCSVALQYHVSCNIGKLSYCRTPDCQMIYRVTKKGSEYNCPSCDNATCTRCQSPYHYGMSCEMYQECKKDVDHSLKVWVKEDKSSRKQCPSCKAFIEKADGCNHMECLNCKAHLCWLCLQVFPTGDKVYDHMPFCPKNQ